jgi:PAS domain-containing protein
MTAVPHEAIALVDVFAFTVRVDGTGAFAWLYFGPNSETIFGGHVSDTLPLPQLMREHAGSEDHGTIDAFLESVVAGERTEVEIRVAGVDGATRWVSWRAVPRELGGQLFVDGVATDVTARHSLGLSLQELAEAQDRFSRELGVRREHTVAVRDANDNVLQRLFAAGLRLQMLQRRLDSTDAHAASAIAFQLDQAATDLRGLIHNLNAVIDEMAEPEVPVAS